MALAQRDVNRGVLEHDRRVRIKEAVLGVIDDLSDHAGLALPPPAAAGEAAPSADEIGAAWHDKSVMCIAGRGSLDEAAAAMLGQLLEKLGIAARVVPSEAVAAASIFRLDGMGVQMICLSYLEPGGFTNARYLVRRLRRKLPGVPILAGFWTLSEDEARHRDALRETGADLIVTSLQQAAGRCRKAAAPRAGTPAPPHIRVAPPVG